MAHVIEFQGRLGRTDGRDVAAGRIDLRFRLHLAQEGAAHLWEERHADVRIASGGGYSVLLGSGAALEAGLFEEDRWLGVYLERGDGAVEVGDRVPLTGVTLRLADQLRALNARMDATDAMTADRSPFEGDGVDVPARRRVLKLHRRLRKLERGDGLLARLDVRIRELEARVSRLDDTERGRVLRLEDEVDDIVGQDGDIVDLLERVEALELGHGGPMGLSKGTAEMLARLERAETASLQLQRQLDVHRASLEGLVGRVSQPPAALLPEQIPGPLTVQRGGVHVASGGLLVHDVEGRVAGASKREGILLLNSRAGGDVIVGNKQSGSVVLTASLRAGRTPGVAPVFAVRLPGEVLSPGDVVSLDTSRKQPTARRCEPGGIALGVVVECAAVEVGEGAVVVAIVGVVKVAVRGPVSVGASLEAGEGGAARAGPGPSVGLALSAAGPDSGFVDMLLHA